MPPGGPFGGGPPPGAQGRPASPARPDRARLADRPRSSGTLQPASASLPTCSTRDRLHRQGQRRRRMRSIPSRSPCVGASGDRHALPGLSRPKPAARDRIHPAACGPSNAGGTFAWSELSSRASWESRASTRAAGTSRRTQLHAGRPDRPARRRPKPPTREGRQEKKKDEKKDEQAGDQINVIAIADLDLIGEQFFELRRQKIEDLDSTMSPFVLNCVDVLAGDESFVGLAQEAAQASHAARRSKRRPRSSTRSCQQRPRWPRTRPRTSSTRPRRPSTSRSTQVKSRTDLDERTKEISSRTSRRSPSGGSRSRRPRSRTRS